jgi:hypothetical protein
MKVCLKSAVLAGTAALVAFYASACATVRSEQVAFRKQPGHCQVTEVRPSVFSTVSYVVCWDQEGKEIGMTGGSGTAIADATMTAVLAAAIGAGTGAIAASIPGYPSMLSGF